MLAYYLEVFVEKSTITQIFFVSISNKQRIMIIIIRYFFCSMLRKVVIMLYNIIIIIDYVI